MLKPVWWSSYSGLKDNAPEATGGQARSGRQASQMGELGYNDSQLKARPHVACVFLGRRKRGVRESETFLSVLSHSLYTRSNETGQVSMMALLSNVTHLSKVAAHSLSNEVEEANSDLSNTTVE